jgi:hypothetical protein
MDPIGVANCGGVENGLCKARMCSVVVSVVSIVGFQSIVQSSGEEDKQKSGLDVENFRDPRAVMVRMLYGVDHFSMPGCVRNDSS